MRKILGTILGGIIGALVTAFLRNVTGASSITIDDPTIARWLYIAAGPWAGAIFGALIGLIVANKFTQGIGTDQSVSMRLIVGGGGGALTGALIGFFVGTIPGAIFMLTVGFLREESMDSSMGGALGGFLIGAIVGAVGGVIVASITGFSVGAVLAVWGEEPERKRPDLVVTDKEARAAKAKGKNR